MADAAAAAGEKAPLSGTTGISMKMVIVIGAVILLLGLGGAFALFKFMAGWQGKAGGTTEAGAAKEESDGGAGSKPVALEVKPGTAKVTGPGVMFDVEPFIVNLADVQDARYLKLTVKLELETQEASDELTRRMPQIRDTVLVLLTSKDSASIRSTQGKFQLRDEITQRVNSLLSKPTVRTTYFTDFVVQ